MSLINDARIKKSIYRNMQFNNINQRKKENRVINVWLINDREKDEKGWGFETAGGNKGKCLIGAGYFEYANQKYIY